MAFKDRKTTLVVPESEIQTESCSIVIEVAWERLVG